MTGDDKTRIEYVSGSVEAACALGLADGIGTLSSPSLFFTHIARREKTNILCVNPGRSRICYSGSSRVGRDDASGGSSPIIDVITNFGGAHPIDYA